MKLLFGLLMCLVLLVGCSGGQTLESDSITAGETLETHQDVENTSLTSATEIIEKANALIPATIVATSTSTKTNKEESGSKTVTAANQEAITPTPKAISYNPPPTPDLASLNPCGDLTGNEKDQCESLVKNGMDVSDINEDLCASLIGSAKEICEQMVKTGAGSQHGSSGHSGMSNPCTELSGDNKARCETEIANDPAFGGSGSNFVKSFDPNYIPKIAKSNFTELDKLGRVSKFRSVNGHDFSFNTSEYDPSGTNCRSMKHYMTPVGLPRENALVHITPHTFEWMSIKFFAPTDGVIGDVVHSHSHGEPESQFTIGSTEYPGYYFGFYHVKLAPGLEDGSEVKAGQQIGTLGNEESYAEISVEARVSSREIHLMSFLQVATDEVFEEYRARGINSVSDVIISKEDRDANPIACDRNSEAGWFEGSYKYKPSETFMTWVFESSDNWVFLD